MQKSHKKTKKPFFTSKSLQEIKNFEANLESSVPAQQTRRWINLSATDFAKSIDLSAKTHRLTIKKNAHILKKEDHQVRFCVPIFYETNNSDFAIVPGKIAVCCCKGPVRPIWRLLRAQRTVLFSMATFSLCVWPFCVQLPDGRGPSMFPIVLFCRKCYGPVFLCEFAG